MDTLTPPEGPYHSDHRGPKSMPSMPSMPSEPYPRLLISAARKSSGKTLLTLGLTGAYREDRLDIRLYKKGPDYIDPLWHRAASGSDSFNLDPYLMEPKTCLDTFLERSRGFDLSLIEGNLGLHDGMDPQGGDSSAALARLLGAPVLLVVDSSGMNRNIAAIVHGMKTFDPEANVAGVVLNRVRSPRQEQKQRAAIEHYSGIPVLGSIPALAAPPIAERHLGLITPNEDGEHTAILAAMGKLVREHVDLAGVRELARQAPPLEAPAEINTENTAEHTTAQPARKVPPKTPTVTVGVAHDPAFCFYYRENLEALENEGAQLVFFDSLNDSSLPEVDGLYLGGGFPESFLEALEANRSLRRDIAGRIEGGLPAYAECGGMMYLTRSIIRDGVSREMVGVIPADVQFLEKPAGHGYVELAPSGATSWMKLEREIRGHEFHYSKLINADPNLTYFYEMKRGAGMGNGQDGIVYKNLLASYAHLHTRTVPEWSRDFVGLLRSRRGAAAGDSGAASGPAGKALQG